MKESFLKVGDLFLALTSPVLITFTRFLACTFRKVWSTSALKSFCCHFDIFGNYNPSPNGQIIPLLALKHTSKHSLWEMNGRKYWRLFIVEFLQLNKLKKKSNFNTIYWVSCFFFHWRAIHENACKGLHESTENCWSSF